LFLYPNPGCIDLDLIPYFSGGLNKYDRSC
jgi:hypothetical protein